MALKYIIDAVKEPIQEQVVQTITELAVTKGWEALQKSHKVLSILKKLKLVNLAEDFGVVYVHALAEYGAEKEPKELVQLFALHSVREALENDHRSGASSFTAEVEHQLHTSPQLTALKPHYPHVQSLLSEIKEFKDTVEYVQMQAANPFALKQYNEVKKSLDQLLEEKHRNSFEGQIERYLDKQIAEFQQKYLEGGKYVDLNGKTVISGLKIFTGEIEPGEQWASVMAEKDILYTPLDLFINRWLQNPTSRLLIIMGEYGTGKTTFARHLTHQLASQYRGVSCSNSIVDEKQRIPLYLPLRNFEKTIENFVTRCSNDYGMTTLNHSEFKHQINQDKLLVIFDGFDEMTQRTDADEKRVNFSKLNDLLEESPNSKFILTCREEYFRSKEELHATFRCNANPEIVHLLPLDKEQIKQFLRSHTTDPDAYWKQIDETFDLKDLAKRPVLLELIIKYLPDLLREKKGERIRASDLYHSCIQEELGRVDGKLNTILPGPARLDILKRLAAWMYTNDTLSFDTRQIGEELKLKEVFNVKEDWEYERHLSEFLTFTFLLREDDYQFRMSHKSFRDYLAALVFLEEVNKNALLHFPKRKISGEVQRFMQEHQLDQKYLLALVKSAKGPEAEWQGTNAANLLLALDQEALAGENLSDCVIREVNFMGCKLEETSFHGAVLTGSTFSGTILNAEGLNKADFSDGELSLVFLHLSSLDEVKKIKGLKALDCRANQIVDITPVANIFSLRTFECPNNKILDITPAKGLKNLEVFDFAYNYISEISSIKDMVNLSRLSLFSNKVSDISPVASLLNLKVINFGHNEISDFSSIEGLTNLEHLLFHINQIIDITPVIKMKNLQVITCGSNLITNLNPVADLSKLSRLECSSNKIKDLSPIEGLLNLTALECHSNLIASLRPVAGLTNLQRLVCGSNQIEDLAPVAGLANIVDIECGNNPITDLSPLYSLKKLKNLRLSKGQFSEKALAELREALPGLEIKLV